MNIEDLYAKFSESGEISTDTRNIRQGSLFFALRGDRFNANEFAQDALDKGAQYAVVDQADYAASNRHILVEDTLKTLQALARLHRDHLEIPVIALTGSNGKTTSKELISAVLGKKYSTYATRGNLNNHIGVPLTLLRITARHEIAVVEMGANHLGEIAMLCTLANPTHGLITNIGRAHIGLFGGFDHIIRAKSELYQHLLAHGGIAFVNSQNEILAGMANRFDSPVMYPASGDYYHAVLLDADPYVRFRAENGSEVATHMIGTYNFENIAAALCIGKYFGVDPVLANEAVAAYRPDNMRSQVIQQNSNTIILDAYNANPSSMQAAIENLARTRSERKVLVLGDMFELESESEKEHRALGALVRQHGFTEVYLCGSLIESALDEIPYARHFRNKADLINELKHAAIRNATVLVKASRGIGLEDVVNYL
jgi:UDP-N-acetylmuramoyl-tripeptide--D-alanyl-D-alanine ligase